MIKGADDPLGRLEDSLKKLRTAYEKYFAGIDRVEPAKERVDLKKAVRRLLGQRTANTARRFRLQTLQASLITHESYWDRVTRQIEEGTHRRDRFRLQRRHADASGDDKTAEPEPAPAPQKPVPVNGAVYPPGLHKLHEAFLRARAETGDTRPVPIKKLAETLRKQTAAIKNRVECKRVDFKVAIKDGRAILKAVPRT